MTIWLVIGRNSELRYRHCYWERKSQMRSSLLTALTDKRTKLSTAVFCQFNSKSLRLSKDGMKERFVIAQTRHNDMLMGVICQFALLFWLFFLINSNCCLAFSVQTEDETLVRETVAREQKVGPMSDTQHCSTFLSRVDSAGYEWCDNIWTSHSICAIMQARLYGLCVRRGTPPTTFQPLHQSELKWISWVKSKRDHRVTVL